MPVKLLCPWDFPGNSTGVGSHSLLQGIFLSRGSNPGLLYCRQNLYCLSQHTVGPKICFRCLNVSIKIRLIIFFAAKDGEPLYSQQKQDWDLHVCETAEVQDCSWWHCSPQQNNGSSLSIQGRGGQVHPHSGTE